MKEVWMYHPWNLNRDLIKPSDVARLLGKNPDILKEVPVKGLFRVLAYPVAESVVIVRGRHACFAALKCAPERYIPFRGMFRIAGTPYEEYLREKARHSLSDRYVGPETFVRRRMHGNRVAVSDLFTLAEHTPDELKDRETVCSAPPGFPTEYTLLRVTSCEDLRILDDLPRLEDLLDFGGLLSYVRGPEDLHVSNPPENPPAVPREIIEKASPGDCYGPYGQNACWWWQKKTGDIHIVGEGAAEPFSRPSDRSFFHSCSPLEAVFDLFIDRRKIRDLVVHDGITAFSGVNISEDYHFRKVLLPPSLTELGALKCQTEWMKIPPGVKTLRLWNLVTDCGGHLDPVTYAAQTLLLPSQIRFLDGISSLEPVVFWKNVVICGKKPIPDLETWFEANMLNNDRESPARQDGDPGGLLDISYPAAWDQGKKGSYAALVESALRARNPQAPVGPYSMYDPDHREGWTEEDYKAWRKHFHPAE